MTGSATVLGWADRAAFVAALGHRLREHGLRADLSRLESLTLALSVVQLDRRGDLYWSARIALVRHARELAIFDAVFGAVFEEAVLARDPHAWRRGPGSEEAKRWTPPVGRPRHQPDGPDGPDGLALPWMTRPTTSTDDSPSRDDDLWIAEPLPSAAEGLMDVPFDELDPDQLAQLSAWLEAALVDWPHRRTRRDRPHPSGRRIDLRSTLARSRATGFEPVRLARTRPTRVRRPMVMLCDVSRSMQAYTQVYVHLMRAAAVTARAEVFAFSTDIRRLTPALGPRGASGREAVERAAVQLAEQSPGTRIGYSLRRFLASRQGGMARGAVVIVASDGWDADDPAELEAAMIRLHRRARHVIWLNPRSAAPGFAPLTGGMSSVLPHCDQVLPGHSLRAMQDVVRAVVNVR